MESEAEDALRMEREEVEKERMIMEEGGEKVVRESEGAGNMS